MGSVSFQTKKRITKISTPIEKSIKVTHIKNTTKLKTSLSCLNNNLREKL